MTIYETICSDYSGLEHFRAAARAQWGATGVEKATTEMNLQREMRELFLFLNPEAEVTLTAIAGELPWQPEQRAALAQLMEEVLKQIQNESDHRMYRIIARPAYEEEKE